MTVDQYEVYALRLSSVDRPARDNFLHPGERSGGMAMDFMMWLIRWPGGALVVDTGFDPAAAQRRGRVLPPRPADAVRALGVEPESVDRVVLTHLHYDHAGNIGDFPNATVLLQEKELAFATGRLMGYPQLRHFFEVDDIVGVVRGVHGDRVRLVDGSVEVRPGLELHLIGGHTAGLQVVRVHTARGWVVLASDAMHYYANFEERNPFPAVLEVATMLDGYQRLLALAGSVDRLIPGHDPEVFRRYGGNDGVAALHVPPSTG